MKEKKSKKKSKKHDTPAADDASGLSERLELQRTRVICGPELNYHVNTVTSALAYMSVGVDNSWSHDAWARQFRIVITRREADSLEFEMIGVDPSITNALRRILISEVPTVAIEHVFVIDNTSEMAEEVLSHRLGLVPLAVDAEALEDRGDVANEKNTVVFKLHVQCRRDPGGALEHGKVYARDLEWLRSGSEYPEETSTHFSAPQAAELRGEAVHGDILLCKLAPGQCIELEAHAIRGQGWDHAKWSPVATAWHRMYPELVIKKAVPEAVAKELAEKVPQVFTVGKGDLKGCRLQAKDVRHHEHYLERIRDMSGEEPYKDYLEVRKRKEHCIFTIEPCVSVPPEQLLMRALRILKGKCQRLEGML